MFITEFFGLFSLSAFANWGFLMAFFFNVFIFSLGLKRDTALLLSSFIMMVSYSISDHLFNWLAIKNSVYLDWALYDYATVTALFVAYFLFKKTTASFLYLVVGLFINSVLSLCMYYDLYVSNNREPWLLWDIYTFSVNLIDFTMIVVLIVDRDILGLNILKNKICKFFNTSANSEAF